MVIRVFGYSHKLQAGAALCAAPLRDEVSISVRVVESLAGPTAQGAWRRAAPSAYAVGLAVETAVYGQEDVTRGGGVWPRSNTPDPHLLPFRLEDVTCVLRDITPCQQSNRGGTQVTAGGEGRPALTMTRRLRSPGADKQNMPGQYS